MEVNLSLVDVLGQTVGLGAHHHEERVVRLGEAHDRGLLRLGLSARRKVTQVNRQYARFLGQVFKSLVTG